MKCRVLGALFLVGTLARVVSGQVPAGGEFQVNTYTTSHQEYPSVASDSGGNFIVVWTSRGQDGSLSGVFGQRYDASGASKGTEFQVNSYTTSSQWAPEVASDGAGNLVVAWPSTSQDGSDSGVFAQRYSASGAARGSEFQVNTYTTRNQGRPRVAADAAGNFVIAWPSQEQDGAFGDGVFAQRHDASGAMRGAESQVNSHTTGYQTWPSVALDAIGNSIVVWESRDAQDGSYSGVFAQRYDALGARRGVEFQVNTYTTGSQYMPAVASDAPGNFIVVWHGWHQDGGNRSVFAQRYDPSGAKRGSEFQVNTYTSNFAGLPRVAVDAAGNFIVVWSGVTHDGEFWGVFAQRYDGSGARRGVEFQVNTCQCSAGDPQVASDAVGNFVVVWQSDGQDGSLEGVYAQRFGGLLPAALAVDPPDALVEGDGNGVVEAGESVAVRPSWRNDNGSAQSFDGGVLSFGGPQAPGISYELQKALARYGTVANGATAMCSDCYQLGVEMSGARPATHWDATLKERLSPDALGQTKLWSLHLGESFADVGKTSPYYRFVETLLHRNVTGGCSATDYCPANAVSREQMSVFVLVGKEGAGFLPAACRTPVFGDVPASSPFCRFIEELSRRGVVSGCGGGNYCPTSAVTREQMSVFLLHTLDPLLDPPACGTPMFGDVPASSPFCRWIEELARRGITGGCSPGLYCPTNPVTREQMAVFVTATFGLSLYGP